MHIPYGGTYMYILPLQYLGHRKTSINYCSTFEKALGPNLFTCSKENVIHGSLTYMYMTVNGQSTQITKKKPLIKVFFHLHV